MKNKLNKSHEKKGRGRIKNCKPNINQTAVTAVVERKQDKTNLLNWSEYGRPRQLL